MLNIDRALGDDRLIKAMTGLSASKFNELIESFGEEFQNEARLLIHSYNQPNASTA
jgi:transposase